MGCCQTRDCGDMIYVFNSQSNACAVLDNKELFDRNTQTKECNEKNNQDNDNEEQDKDKDKDQEEYHKQSTNIVIEMKTNKIIEVKSNNNTRNEQRKSSNFSFGDFINRESEIMIETPNENRVETPTNNENILKSAEYSFNSNPFSFKGNSNDQKDMLNIKSKRNKVNDIDIFSNGEDNGTQVKRALTMTEKCQKYIARNSYKMNHDHGEAKVIINKNVN